MISRGRVWLSLCVGLAAALARAEEPGLWKPVRLPAAAAAADLRAIQFLDDRLGWIVGDRGLCLATTDGGATWEKRDTGSTATLRCVRFRDASHGFACGDGDAKAPGPREDGHWCGGHPARCGTLLATADGGRTWKTHWVPSNFELWCVEASAAPKLQLGIGLEGHLDGDITRSSDGGATWTWERAFRSLGDIRAVTATRWVAVGSPVSVEFVTGGEKIEEPLWLAKACRAVVSDDAGATWKPAKGSDGKAVLRSLLIGKNLPLFAVGDAGALMRSDDAGDTWEPLESPAAIQLRAIAAAGDGAAIVAVGERSGFVLSTDGGRTWRVSCVGDTRRLHAIAGCGGRFIAVGDRGAAFVVDAAVLAAAKDLPPLPPPSEEPPPPIHGPGPRPAKDPTAAQQARVQVGDSWLLTTRMTISVPGLDAQEQQEKSTVTAVDDNTYTVDHEPIGAATLQGDDGKPSKRWVTRAWIAELPEFDELEIGKGKEFKTNAGAVVATRLADENLEADGRTLGSVVVQEVLEQPDGGKVEKKSWYCPAVVPGDGLLKAEITKTVTLPIVGKATVKVTTESSAWTRGRTEARAAKASAAR